MKSVKSAVLISVFATLGFLSGCGPAEPETGAQPASVESASQPLCEMSFCNSDADCSPCPGYTVSCNGFVCAFTSTTGGGGSGGGGGYCDGAFCNTDSDCTSVCHNTSTPWCNNGICAP